MASSTLEALPAGAIGLSEEFAKLPSLEELELSFGKLRVFQAKDSIWLLVTIGRGGGYALRGGYLPGNRILHVEQKDGWNYKVKYSGATIDLAISEGGNSTLRLATQITPNENLIVPYLPRDFYPVDGDGDATKTAGTLHTSQVGFASPVVYLSLEKPETGSFLYYQNLTALNPYFDLTGTTPDGSVGGKWPELGYLPPTSSDLAMPAGRPTLVSDAIVVFDPKIPGTAQEMSRQFIDLLAAVSGQIEHPQHERHDWIGLCEKSLADLDSSPAATVEFWDCTFLRPYTDAEHPDVMVQTNVLHGLIDYDRWRGRKRPLARKLQKGISRFYDRKLKTMRRYLPNVGKDKDKNEVDSWYMYHPLMSLARLARDGEEWAQKLFFASLETAISFARKFKYKWPVMFDLLTGKVIREDRREGEPGQSDVAGLYTYVMMQAFELSGDPRYVDEASKAIEAIKDLRFELAYQLNTTAWGVTGCLKLFKQTGEQRHLDQAIVFLAAFMRHMIFWESDIKLAKEFSTFMGVLCLDDTRYMALFECHESFEAFWEALSFANDDLPESARSLMADYGRYALHRAWFYYPQFLPKDGLSKAVRNGYIDRSLHFPLEDLYPDGQAAGQVGQEVYGCGGSFAFATNAFHRIEGASFILYCDCAIRDLETIDNAASFTIAGSSHSRYRLEILPKSKKPFSAFFIDEGRKRVLTVGKPVDVTGNRRYQIQWR